MSKSKKISGETTVNELVKRFGASHQIIEAAVEKAVKNCSDVIQGGLEDVIQDELYKMSNNKEVVGLINAKLKDKIKENLDQLVDKALKRTVIYCEEP